MKKILAIMAVAAVSAMAISANRVGPVSTYGELKANGSKLSGSCPQYQNEAVQVKGMSLFWSSAADSATAFYTEKAVNLMVKDMGIEVLRFAMGVSNSFDKGRGYITGGEDLQKAYLKNVVNAAIENDIYVIIDWHIESSTGYTDDAVKFFDYAAETYGEYNNVIFEVWNEPTGGWSEVKSHADRVISAIRKHSDNLILIGSTGWSSNPAECAGSFSDKNYGCTLHFYAATHPANGDKAQSAASAMSKGVPVFATEWGTVSADGNGGANQGESEKWISWMDQNKISWANWSASAVNEGSAAFNKINLDNGLSYSTSGNMVKGWMNKGKSYKDCGLQNGSSSGNSGFSTGVANGAKTDLIDDVEDNDHYAYTGGFWSAWTDAGESGTNGVGKSTLTNAKWENDFGKEVYDVLLPSDGGKNTSKYMVGMKGIKLGASHNFRLETSLVTNWNFHHVNKDASEEWKEVELTWDQFNQEDWGDNDKHFNLKDKGLDKVMRLAWEVKGVLNVPDAQNQPSLDYLYVDDVRCDGMSISAISGGAGDTPKSSSSSNGGKSSSSKGGKSSSSIAPTQSSSSVAPVIKDLLVIDDVEDVDEVLNTTGTWYAYTDVEGGGQSAITNVYDPALPGYVVVFPGTKDATNGTQGFVGLEGISWKDGTLTYDPFVALGVNLNADTSKGVDLTNCPVISYRYKGNGHTIKLQDGQVTDFAFHNRRVESAAEWTTITFAQDEFKQPSWTETKVDFNWANVKKMSWEVIGALGYSDEFQPEYNYLYVDDLKCVAAGSVGVRVSRKAASDLKLTVNGDMLNVVTTAAARIQVFDMQGNMVMNRVENAAGNHQVSFQGMNRGNYVVRVKSAGMAKTARISIR